TNSLLLLLGERTIIPWTTRSATTSMVSMDKRTKYQVRGLAALGLSALGTRTRQKLCSKQGIVESIRRVADTATQTPATELSLGFMEGHIVRCPNERIREKN